MRVQDRSLGFMQRRGVVVSLILGVLLLAAVQIGASANQDLTNNQFSRLNQDVDILDFEVNHTGEYGTLTEVAINFTGENTTTLDTLVGNVTLWNTTSSTRYGFNDTAGTWSPSGTRFVFNVTNTSIAAANITANETTLRLNVTLGSAGDGSAVDFSVTDVYGTGVELNTPTTPYSGGSNTNITVDETAPGVSITEPTHAANLSGSGHSLSADITNDTTAGRDSGVNRSSAAYIFENSTGRFDASGAPGGWTTLLHDSSVTHSTTFDVSGLTDGTYAVYVRANDTVDIGPDNRNDTVFVNITVDNTPPILTPVDPGAAANVSGTFSITATRSDATSGLQNTWFNITQGGTSHLTGTLNDTNVDSSTSLNGDGTYNISYNATDYAGNVRTKADWFTITVDNTPPTVTIHDPENATFARSALDLNVTGVDATTIDTWQYEKDANGTNVTFVPNGTLSGLTYGGHTINVFANDSAGNWGSAAQTFTVDTTAPSLSATLPVDGANLSGVFTVNATWSDTTTNVTTTSFNITNSTIGPAWKTGSLNNTVNASTLADGEYNISYTATDFAGNVRSLIDEVAVTIDTTSPTISYNPSTTDAGYQSTNTITVNVSASDSPAGLDWVRKNIDGSNTTFANSGNGWYWEDTVVNDGQHTFFAWANDTAGNRMMLSSRSVTVDTAVPTNLTVHTPTDAANVSGTIYVNTTWSDATTNVTARMFWLSNSTHTHAAVGDANTTLNTGILANGAYNISFNATDFVGNTNTTNNHTTITVDNTAPSLTVLEPQAQSYSDTFTVNASWGDADSGVLNASFNVTNSTAGVEWIKKPLNGTVDSTTLTDGNYTIYYTITDHAGNIATDAVEVNLDNNPPSFVSSTPADGANVSGTLTVGAFWDESISQGMFNLTNSTAGWSYVDTNGSSINTASVLADGQYNLSFNATDGVGNLGAAVRTTGITVDNTAPAVIDNAHIGQNGYGVINGDPDGRFSSVADTNNVVNLSVNITDSVTGVETVTFDMSSMCSGANAVTGTFANGLWWANCTVDTQSGSGYFSGERIQINATDYASGFNDSIYRDVVVYNFTLPPNPPAMMVDGKQRQLMRFDQDLTTNLSTKTDLTDVRYVFAPRLNGTVIELLEGFEKGQLWSGFRHAMTMNISSIDFTDPATQQSLDQMGSAIDVTIHPKRTYGENRIYVNTTAFSAFNTSTNITLNWLPLESVDAGFIKEDPDAAGNVIFRSYKKNSDGTGNLTFSVNGFSGYNITDTDDPVITMHSPKDNWDNSTFVFNATFNGTGTQINNETTALTLTGTSNTFTYNHSELSCGGPGEIVDCTLSPSIPDDTYNVTITVGDFGGTNGNNATTNVNNVTLDTTAPSVTLHSPTNATFSDDTPDLNVTADEPVANWFYNVDSNANTSFTPNTTLASLPDGSHDVTVWANDSLGNIGRTTEYFAVDTVAPSISSVWPEDGSTVSGTINISATWNDATSAVTGMYNITQSGTVSAAGSLNDTSFDTNTLSDGDYNISYNATDAAGNTAANVSYVTITVDNPEPSSSDDDDDDSSSGGSISITGSFGSGLSSTSKVFSRIEPGTVATTTVKDAETYGVNSVSISVNTPANNVKIKVIKQDSAPADVSVSVDRTTYRYLNIEASGVTGNDIDTATIQFEVNKSWIRDNDLDERSVRLERYHDNDWVRLPTRIVARNQDTLAYEAETPGFSYFAVSGDPVADDTGTDNDTEPNVVDNVTSPACGDGTCNGNETWNSCRADCEPPAAVQSAEQVLDTARTAIKEDSAGYTTLQSAESAFDQGEYARAEQLANQALDEHRQSGPDFIKLYLIAAGLIIGLAGLYLWRRLNR